MPECKRTEIRNWQIIEYKSRLEDHRRGWLINKKSGTRYVWNMGKKGIIRFMRQPKPVTNIPLFIERIIKEDKA
jgi:hypothetical protein